MKTIRKTLAILLSLSILLLLASCASVEQPQATAQTLEEGTELKMHFYNVPNITGWGDCTFIEFPNGQTMLIDAGTQDAGKVIVKDLLEKGITEIDYLIITHYHKDHVNGLREVLTRIKIHKAYTTGYYPTDFKWVDSFVKQYVDELNFISAGYTLDVGSVHFNFLWPFASDISVLPTGASSAEDGQSGCNKDINNHSMVFTMKYKNNTVLFTADVCAAEAQIIGQYMNDLSVLDCDVMKIPHHGYSTSSSEEFVAAASPMYAFSMGTAVMDTSVFTRYYNKGCKVYMSWQNGNSYVTMDGENISVTCDTEGYAPAYSTFVGAYERMHDNAAAVEEPAVVADKTVQAASWTELKTQVQAATGVTEIRITADLVADQTIVVPANVNVIITDDGTARTISRGNLTASCFTISDGATVTIKGSQAGMLVLDGSNVDAGAAMVSSAGITHLENLVIKNCRNTSGEGGAVLVEKNNLAAKNTTFESNYATAGGAIATVTKMVSITDIDGCTFTNNTAKTNGGALNIMNSNVLFMSNSTLTGNTTESTAKNKGGAALYMAVTNSTISGCTFKDNVVHSSVTDGSITGGAILYYCLGAGDNENTISNCTFSGNGGVEYGGAIGIGDNGKTRSKNAVVTIEGCTFESNLAIKGTGFGARFSNSITSVTLKVKDCNFTSDTAYAPDQTRTIWNGNNISLTTD